MLRAARKLRFSGEAPHARHVYALAAYLMARYGFPVVGG
jgi:hypothetical protein